MTTAAAPVRGHVEEGWGKVADAFRANFEGNPGEVGAACCVYVGGRPVVDLWGGFADREANRPWNEDTIALVASTTKGATAICAHLLAQRGELDLDAPVVEYWPEFGAAGKEQIPVRWLLSHQAGLPVIDAPLTFEDACAWHPVIRALEAQKPLWQPGTEHLYHAAHLRVPRRRGRAADHRQDARHLLRRRGRCSARAERLDRAARGAGGEGDPDHVRPVQPRGADRRDDRSHRPRCGHGHRLDRPLFDAGLGGRPRRRAWRRVRSHQRLLQQRAFRAAEFPCCEHGRRRSIAGADVRRHGERGRRRAAAGSGDGREDDGRPDRQDADARAAARTGTSGRPLLLHVARVLAGLPADAFGRAGSFGHPGSGGSVGFADPDAGVGFGYVPNLWSWNIAEPRAKNLAAAVAACLG